MKTITIEIPLEIAERFDECLWRAEHNMPCNSKAVDRRTPNCKYLNKCDFNEPVATVNKLITKALKRSHNSNEMNLGVKE